MSSAPPTAAVPLDREPERAVRPSGRARSAGRLPLWAALLAAVAGGVLTAFAFPGISWWPLAFIGVPLILAATIGRRVWSGLLVGLIGGFAFWGTLIFWLTVYLGPEPWLALAGLEAIFFAIGCLAITLAWHFGDRVFRSRTVSTLIVPLVVAALWTGREVVASTWPYGGFSWGRIAFSQSESPLASLVAWVGISGLSFLMAWVSALLVHAARLAWMRDRPDAGNPRHGALGAVLAAGLLIVMVAVPAFPVVESGSIRVAAVQGDSDAGLFAEYTPGEILQNHLDATYPLYGDDVDLVVWPETASDLDPLRVSQAASALDYVTEQMSAPLITGTVTSEGSDDDRKIWNSLLLWENGEGAVDQYDKIHPVPFAEYIPDRDFWYPLAPDLLSLIPRDYEIGTRDNVFDVDGVTAGLAICFDIVDDGLIRDMMSSGADLIVAPSNNADFGRTDESVQQLAIARLRAIETGRSVVNASTVGTSAIIGPDGRLIDRLPTFTSGAMEQDVPLSTTTTLATVAGQWIELVVELFGLIALVVLGVVARRRGRAERSGA